MTTTPSIADYDAIFWILGVVSGLVYLFPFMLPRRERVANGETPSHYLKEGFEETYPRLKRTCLGITFQANGKYWCGDKLTCCRPFDHESWYHLGAMCCMSVPFTLQIIYLFDRFGNYDMDTHKIVWVSWGISVVPSFFLTIKGVGHDLGFLLATWVTVGIWGIKIVNVNLTTIGEGFVLAGIVVLSIVMLSVCVFCGIFGCCMLACTCKCCRDDISHAIAKVFLRFNVYACVSIAVILSWSVGYPGNGLGNYRDNDREWLLMRMYYVIGAILIGYIYRLLFWHKSNGCCSFCTCCSYCREHFYDKDKHVLGDVNPCTVLCGCCCHDPTEEAEREKQALLRKQRKVQLSVKRKTGGTSDASMNGGSGVPEAPQVRIEWPTVPTSQITGCNSQKGPRRIQIDSDDDEEEPPETKPLKPVVTAKKKKKKNHVHHDAEFIAV